MKLEKIRASLVEWIEQRERTLYTFVPAILRELTRSEMRGVVTKKDDREVMADNVPILTPFAGDDVGEIHPITLPDEGFMLCANYPLDDVVRRSGVVDSVRKQRHHSFQDGIFVSAPWNDPEKVPEHAKGEYLYKHPSDAIRRITPAGDFEFEHPAGHRIELATDGATVEFERSDGETVTVRVTETGASITSPDTRSDYSTSANPTTEIGVDEDGTARLDGIATVGDSDASRVDRTQENTDPEDPRTYAEVDEPAEPIVDPTDAGETAYANPSTVRVAGAVDYQGYESRNHVVERREADPDPTVTDPTNPAYYPGDSVPLGYEWINVTDMVKRIWGSSDAPVDIKPI